MAAAAALAAAAAAACASSAAVWSVRVGLSTGYAGLSGSLRWRTLLSLLLLLLPLLLLLQLQPTNSRVLFVSPHGGALFGFSASIDAEFAPWGPPVEEVVGQLVYKGSSCAAANPTLLGFSYLDFRPQLLQLSLVNKLKGLAGHLLPSADPRAAAPITTAAPPLVPLGYATAPPPGGGEPREWASDPLEAIAAAAKAEADAAAGGAAATNGDSWRWALQRTGRLRRESLHLLLPFVSTLILRAITTDLNSTSATAGLPLSPSTLLEQQQQQADQRPVDPTGAAALPPAAEPAAAPAVPATGLDGSERGGLKGVFKGLSLRGSRWRLAGVQKRVWLFDRCTEKELLQLIRAANSSGVAALLLTDTPFKDYSLPLLGNVFAPQPLMPVVSLPNSPLLQHVKQRAAAAAATAAAEPLYALVDRLPSKGADCRAQQPLLLASLVSLPLWCLLAWKAQRESSGAAGRDATALHRLLLLPPALKAAAAAAQSVFLLQCPSWSSSGSQYLVMAVLTFETLFQTSFSACLLLISKGFLIIQETLTSKQSLTLALLVSAVYVLSSVNQVDPLECLPLRLLLLLLICIVVLRSCKDCILKIELRLEYVRAAGLQELQAALELKERMFKIHAISCCLFFVCSAVSSLTCLLLLDRPDLSDAVSYGLELALWAVVAFTFKPRRGLPYFSLLQSNEQQSVLPMYAAAPLLRRSEDGASMWGSEAASAVAAAGEAAAAGGTVGSAAAGAAGRGAAGGGGPFSEPFPEDCPIVILNPSSPGQREAVFKDVALGTLYTCTRVCVFFVGCLVPSHQHQQHQMQQQKVRQQQKPGVSTLRASCVEGL
ncbi:hypothetical protein, conserved [Eimeria maxima]|uniref:Uncharacterized protein n=1 Tax=Eimeria maxima TaxID=5804 RepID=U6M8P3_EIMMA|nr:hypothetical protein, conserved [Eimeria maxima]CDJ58859.1 hypothetical protein, conserved [Eimeria maxima]